MRYFAAALLVACGSHADDVASWERRWQDARRCLAGDTSGTTAQAVAIRALAGAPAPACRDDIDALQRLAGDRDGERRLADASARLAAATADDDRIAALEAIEAVRDDLGLGAARSLPAAERIALPGVVSLAPLPLPTAGGVVAFGNTTASGVEIAMPIGGTPTIEPVRVGVVRSPNAPGLGAVGEIDRARVGAIDEHGKMSDRAPMVLWPRGAGSGAAADRRTSALVAVGDGRAGAFALAARTALVLVRTQPVPTDIHEVFEPDDPRLGFRTAELASEVDDVAAAIDPGGRAAIAWRSGDALSGLRIDPKAAVDNVADVGHGAHLAPELCLAKERVWMRAGDDIYGFTDDPGYGPASYPRFAIAGCGASGAVLRDEHRFVVCSDTCDAATGPTGAPADAPATVVRGKVVQAAIRGGVLAIYADAPAYYAVPGAVHAELVMSDDRTIDVIASTRDGYAVVRVPR